jgi:hypothetical protein
MGDQGIYKDLLSIPLVGIRFGAWWQMPCGVGQGSVPARARRIGRP